MHAADHGTRRWRHDVSHRTRLHSHGWQRAKISRAQNLLRGPQLRRALARDGLGPIARGAVLFPDAHGRYPARAAGRDHRPPLPICQQELSLRSGTGRPIGKRGANIPADKALDYVIGYAVGLDMTRRDLQRMMGDQKKPWEVGKSFDHAAVVSHLHPVASVGHLKEGAIWLKVNGETRQSDNIKDMIWSLAEDRQPLAVLRAIPRRHHLFRHAEKCRPRRAGGCYGGAH